LVLHESGLLAVTIMGVILANANLPSYTELLRFKEHATVLLVSGVFILLAASLDFETLGQLTWRAVIFVAAVVLLARPITVLVSLIGSGIPFKEQLLVAFTGPRGVVLVAVAGLFGERLTELGLPDAHLIAPLAFALVAATVVLHGFTLAPVARALGLTASETPGVLIVGGSPWTTALAESLQGEGIPVLMSDPNYGNLRGARAAGIDTFSGDILSEAAEQRLELVSFEIVIAATSNDAYNTLVATDLAPEFGRANVFQVMREQAGSARYDLPTTLGGKRFGPEETFDDLNRLVRDGWSFAITPLSEEFTFEHWRETHPDAHVLATIDKSDVVRFSAAEDTGAVPSTARVLALRPPEAAKS